MCTIAIRLQIANDPSVSSLLDLASRAKRIGPFRSTVCSHSQFVDETECVCRVISGRYLEGFQPAPGEKKVCLARQGSGYRVDIEATFSILHSRKQAAELLVAFIQKNRPGGRRRSLEPSHQGDGSMRAPDIRAISYQPASNTAAICLTIG